MAYGAKNESSESAESKNGISALGKPGKPSLGLSPLKFSRAIRVLPCHLNVDMIFGRDKVRALRSLSAILGALHAFDFRLV